MNRNLFGLLVIIFCILLVSGMAACESRSGRMATEKAQRTTTKEVRIVLVKEYPNQYWDKKLYKVRTIPYDSLTHFATVPIIYAVNDTIMTSQTITYK